MLQKFWGAKEKNEKNCYDEKKRKVRKKGRIKKEKEREKNEKEIK
jgi:hypothetical protein